LKFKRKRKQNELKFKRNRKQNEFKFKRKRKQNEFEFKRKRKQNGIEVHMKRRHNSLRLPNHTLTRNAKRKQFRSQPSSPNFARLFLGQNSSNSRHK